MKNLIVIVNWNNQKDTERCLQSILDELPEATDILIIDNHSDERDWIETGFGNLDAVFLKLNDENLGFTRASNQGFEFALANGYDYVTFINNDAYCADGFMRKLDSHLEKDSPDMLSCKILQAEKPELLDNVGHRMINTGEIIPIGFDEPAVKYQKPFYNFGSCAAATSYSLRMVRDIGVYDPYFSTGYEDAEFGARAIVSGYRSMYFPDLEVYHKISASVKRIDNTAYRVGQQKAIFYTYFKLMPWPVIAAGLPFIILKYLLVVLAEFLLLRWGYIRVHFLTLRGLLSEINIIRRARKDFQKNRVLVNPFQIIRKQVFFLFFDLKRLYAFTLGRKKTVFDTSAEREQ